MTDSPLLSLDHVGKAYRGVPALWDVSLRLDRKTIHAVIGHNGAGKSTVMRILCGATAADEGRIVIEGREVRFASPAEARAAGISMVHQELSLVDDLDVAENIALGREPVRAGGLVDRAARDRRAAGALAELGLALDLRRLCGDLAAGERQMVEIARALSGEARVLILDEPTASLTRTEQEALFAVLRRLRERIGIFYISHRLDEILDLADVVTVLREGRDVARFARGGFDHRALVEAMLGEAQQPAARSRRDHSGEVLLELVNARYFRSASQGVSLRLCRGEILGLAGLMGAGRSELFESLFGLRPLVSGRITFEGRPHVPANPAQAVARGIALVPEDRKAQGLFAGAALWWNIGLASLRDRFARWGLVDRAGARDVATRQVAALGLRAASLDLDIARLSGGNQQKAILARWLLREPRLLMLDEPTAGIDIGAKAEIHRLIRGLAESGMGVLVASSEFDELLALCDRILVLRDGGVVAELPAAEATEEDLMLHATGGTAAKREAA